MELAALCSKQAKAEEEIKEAVEKSKDAQFEETETHYLQQAEQIKVIVFKRGYDVALGDAGILLSLHHWLKPKLVLRLVKLFYLLTWRRLQVVCWLPSKSFCPSCGHSSRSFFFLYKECCRPTFWWKEILLPFTYFLIPYFPILTTTVGFFQTPFLPTLKSSCLSC